MKFDFEMFAMTSVGPKTHISIFVHTRFTLHIEDIGSLLMSFKKFAQMPMVCVSYTYVLRVCQSP